MVDREMLSAISELLDEKLEQKLEQKFDDKLQPVYERMDRFEANVIPRLESLEADVKDLKTDVEGLKTDVEGLRTDVDGLEVKVEGLKDEIRYVRVVQLENNVIPRLSTIESCYLDTFHRYVERTEQIDNMAADIEILKGVVSEHSRKLEKIPG